MNVTANDTVRQIVYEFWLAFHSNYGLVLYHFQDKALRRAGLVSFGRLVVDTSGEFSCGNERIVGAAVRSVRAVGSLHVTVLGSAAYKGAQYLVRVWRGSRRDLTRLRRLL